MVKHRSYRFYIERIGLLLLLIGVWYQRAFIANAVAAIIDANLLLVVLCLSLQWLVFFWSGLGYYILTNGRIKLVDICLANLAAAGPGRVVPAGAGQLSFSTLFLKKHRYKTEKSLAIALTNNLMGFLVNIATVSSILLFVSHPKSQSNAATNVYVIVGIVVGFIVCISITPLRQKIIGFIKTMIATLKGPKATAQLALSALALLLTNSIILVFASLSVGLHISVAQAVLIMSSGVALGSVVPTPGGIGGIEAGMVAMFVAFGFDQTLATTATIIYRVATYIQPLLPGLWAYIYLRRKNKL